MQLSDFDDLDPEEVDVLMACLHDAIIRTEVEALDEPHVVLFTDPGSGICAASGPYDSALEALQAAERYQQELSECDTPTACSIIQLTAP